MGVAIARVMPEPSGDDVSFYLLEVRENVSTHSMQTALAAAKLDVTWIGVGTVKPGMRHHLLECRGFVPENHEGMQKALATMGRSLLNVAFLGAYALPLRLSQEKNNDLKPLAKAPRAHSAT
jgi:hypothetical protein